ncbi:Gamma-glutamyltranspeptidase family-containing protein [Strongyloides ratti]|uniref:Gamma-glutamyltranspeptidase family-containing protein n=1 Tax=Strongyloides ratti TaxID=34506 RepID=A0A090LGU5_STRRB|nr:Gamma-glutamyltranspeptidase family-containing protein [Strongyloides ratti]CEF69007.1 Gamma-glutamyltranspeptidase family-containing protein [Strongyloides ratti]
MGSALTKYHSRKHSIYINRFKENPFATSDTNLNNMENKKSCLSKNITIVLLIIALLFFILTIVLATLFGLIITKKISLFDDENIVSNGKDNILEIDNNIVWPSPSGSLYGNFSKAAVSTDNGLCSEIGRDILKRGGNAIDSIIASLICIGTVNPQSSGLGGGLLMTFYNQTSKKCITIDARETAPMAARSDMYVNDTLKSLNGYSSIAVPGELHGLWTAFTKYGSGKIKWAELFQDSIKLAKEGFPVTKHMVDSILIRKDIIEKDEGIKKIFTNKKTGKWYKEGDIIKREIFAATLENLANSENPINLFYKEGIAQTIAEEIKSNNGIITLEDLMKYETKIYEEPIEIDGLPEDLIMCGPKPPSSFVIMQIIVKTMSYFYQNTTNHKLNDPLFYHRLIETMKFAYAQRSQLGDTDFVKNITQFIQHMSSNDYSIDIGQKIKDKAQPLEYYTDSIKYFPSDHGTSQVVAIDIDGNAVSCTSTINRHFGSGRMSSSLGIFYNDEMDDFSTPNLINSFGFRPSKANFIEPGKRPMTSMSPTIIYNKNNGKVKMVIGSAGGSFIISAIAQIITRNLFFNQTIKEANDMVRIHNQFLPDVTEYEEGFPKQLVDILTNKYDQKMKQVKKQASSVQILETLKDGTIVGNSDWRKTINVYPAGF